VANVLRAHSLLLSFPEVDQARTAITGISWGGYLTCIVAGLDNRYKAAVPVYGCGFLHDNSTWLKEFARMTPDQRALWIRLWEPSKYVGSTSVPCLFVNGGKDFAYPPDSYAKTYALVRAPKNIHFVPDLRHGHIFDRPKAVQVFIEQKLKNGAPLPLIGELNIAKGRVQATVETKTTLRSAKLHYTTDALPGNNRARTWQLQAATLAGGKITATLPPADTTVWFLTVVDVRGVLVSSRLVVSKK
jgi:dienelactone hydrolase